jgi:hypothetical protein
MSDTPQSFASHARIVPAYHYFVFPVLAANAIWLTTRALRLPPGLDSILPAFTAWALVVLAFLARIFALTVQDRVIRLEMRLRLRELLPPELQPRIAEFTRGQLVALRFAGDRELPVLARRVLDEKLQDRKAIKALIQEWQADHLRA